jgi:hypothetical protein
MLSKKVKVIKYDYFSRLTTVTLIYPFIYCIKAMALPMQYLLDLVTAILGSKLDCEKEEKDRDTDLFNFDVSEFETLDNNVYVQDCPYRILIPENIWMKMIYLVKNCPTEMGGHLLIEEKDYKIIIKDILIPEQIGSHSEYIPNHRDLLKYPKALPLVKGWFHSHVNFDAFWSGTDDETIKNSVSVFNKYCISIVMNKRNEYRIRLDTKTEKYDNLPLNVILDADPKIEQYCITELRNKVKRQSFIRNVKSVFQVIKEKLGFGVVKNEL